MLCSKCYEKISQGEEVQINSSIICKKCALTEKSKKEVIAKCQTCNWPIYKGELTHESSGSLNFGLFGFFNFIKHWKLIQCRFCYQQWLNEKKKEEKWRKKYKRVLRLCKILLLIIGIFLLCLGYFYKKFFYYASLLAFIPLVVLILSPIFRYAEISRYKFRKRERETK